MTSRSNHPILGRWIVGTVSVCGPYSSPISKQSYPKNLKKKLTILKFENPYHHTWCPKIYNTQISKKNIKSPTLIVRNLISLFTKNTWKLKIPIYSSKIPHDHMFEYAIPKSHGSYVFFPLEQQKKNTLRYPPCSDKPKSIIHMVNSPFWLLKSYWIILNPNLSPIWTNSHIPIDIIFPVRSPSLTQISSTQRYEHLHIS